MPVSFPRPSWLGSGRTTRPSQRQTSRALRVVAVAAAALLSACGGGEDASTSSTPTITSVNATTLMLRPGETTSVIVRGTGLASANIELTGCSSSQLTSRGSIVAVFECTVGSAPDIVPLLNGKSSGLVLAIPRVDTLVTLETGDLKFGSLTAFRATGHGLDQSVTPVSDACDDILVSKRTSDVLEFDCFISAKTGNVAIQGADSTLFDATYSIDAPNPPLVTFTLEDNTTTPATTRTINVQLDNNLALDTTYNFLRYVAAKFYDNTIFHRVIGTAANAGFEIVQGGYFVGNTSQALIEDSNLANFLANSSSIALQSTQETGLSNTAGTIAMARGDAANSAQAQFYFNATDNSSVFDYKDANNPGYAVFGSVVSAADQNVLTALKDVATQTLTDGTPPPANVPEKTIVIKSVVQTQ